MDKRVTKKLLKHPLTIPGFAVLVFFYIIMIFAEFIAPYHFDNPKREYSFLPPSRIHWVHNGNFSLRPFVYPYAYTFNQYYERVYREDKTTPYFLSLFLQVGNFALQRVA